MSQCGHWMAAEPNEDFQNGEVPWKPVCRLSKYSLVSTCMRVPRISLRRRACQRDGPGPDCPFQVHVPGGMGEIIWV